MSEEVKKDTGKRMEDVTDIKEITLPLIKEYIMRQDEKDIKWLLDILKQRVPNGVDKKGNPKTKKKPFIEIRNEFTKLYFPKLVPKGISKNKSSVVDDTIAELEKALAEKLGNQ